MYSVYADGQPLYVPGSREYIAYGMQYNFAIDEFGSFSITVPPTNPTQQYLLPRRTEIQIYNGTEPIWTGFITRRERNLYNEMTYSCEGILSYLNDSQRLPTTVSGSVEQCLAKFIDDHNAQMWNMPQKQFTLGEVDVVGSVSIVQEEPKPTLQLINEELVDVFGGHLIVREEGGIRYLDYLTEYGNTAKQGIEYGKNLLDLSDIVDTVGLYTVLVPLGKKDDEGIYLTIESVNGGLNYISDDTAVANYTRIVKTQIWSDIEDPSELLAVATQEYARVTTVPATLNINAVDLSAAGVDVEELRVYDRIPVYSAFNGINTVVVCSAISGTIGNPEATTYTLGAALPSNAKQQVKPNKERKFVISGLPSATSEEV